MSVRRPSDSSADARHAPDSTTPARLSTGDTGELDAVPNPRLSLVEPVSLEEAEARYVVARDAWVEAMRRCKSGRAADLASLAIAQEAYEKETAEVERWRSGGRLAITIEPEAKRAGLAAAIGQEMAWRRVHEVKPKEPGLIARAFRRVTGRR